MFLFKAAKVCCAQRLLGEYQGLTRGLELQSRSGFSLIELLIVIAVLGVVTTIAVPLLMSTRRSALNEKARQSVRVVFSAQQAYYSSYGTFGEFGDLTLDAPPFLDSRFTDLGADLGNDIFVTVTTADGGTRFLVEADNPQGTHSYAGDETFVIQEIEN
jgi:prepilin-type N-terminal cleavage/methylation domain-containing protein